MLETSTDVLIVGAGPVGMALAITLAEQGLRPMLVDRALTHQTTSRAAVIHAHTLDILDRIGIAGPMKAEGLQIQNFAFRDRDRMLGTFRFDRLPSRHNYLLMLPQDRTEAIMLTRLAELGVDVVRGATFTTLREEIDHVVVDLQTPEGVTKVSATYVVGADGIHSEVRKACGIAFDGDQYEGSFILADITVEGAQNRDEVSLFFSPAGLVVVAPLPGGRLRIVATVDDAPEKPDASLIQSLLQARGPTAPKLGKVLDVHWSSRFRLHHRLARSYSKGRVFIAGDAAHAHSPAGGQGMNTGIGDAYTLGRLLGRVIVGQADRASLDSYEVLRRPAAAEVLRLAGRMTSAATMRSPLKRAVRNLVLSAMARLPAVRERVELSLSGIARASATVSE
ncbi:FAD-dependent oxidoreductase [Cypionkella sp.]|uniref:FAD-dependent oxidoreductase n=1 Tax=Cypionkella sp. TaxID=2811411 RepID=UPI002AB94223|nr:FAD-dependent oxidoreductase [Cypionkella sp.]MDZ4395682.1 FAD-dependent monooxygenase [Cypionkella sp.]